MSHPSWQCLAAFAIGFCLASPARADPPAQEDYINPDRPGIADGSTVIGAGRFQAELGLQYELHRDDRGHFQLVFVPLLLRFGLSANWELRLEGNSYSWQRTQSGGSTTQTDGYQPESIGAKYHFIDSAGLARPSVGAILRLFPSSGSSVFHTHRLTGDFRLTADWDIAPQWSLNPNIGVARDEDASGRAYTPALFALTLNYNPSETLNFFADAGMQSAESRHGRALVTVDIGTAVIIGHDTQLDASVGYGAMGTIAAPRPFLAVGISERF